MKLFAKFFLSFLLLTTSYLLLTTPIFAEGEFETDYKVLYSVQENGRTDVTQNILLKNKTTNFYAQDFTLRVGKSKVTDVKASDSTGPLNVETKYEDNISSITIKFHNKVIGLDKSMEFLISYSSSDVAIKSGQIWEILLPPIAKTSEIASYQATVSVPLTFGPLISSVPSPKEIKRVGLREQLSYGKDQLLEKGTIISFGEKQIFSYDLHYYLENNRFTSQYAEIALPPDNNYQKITIENIDPKPLNIYADNDGNFIAIYKLKAKSAINVRTQGKVEVFNKPFRNIYAPLSEEERKIYTQPQKYWEVDNAQIREKASELKTPQQIYNFVTEYLAYNDERANQIATDIKNNKLPKNPRKGALSALSDPKNVICVEFTDLFIAITRSAGIPAREIQGYGYTKNPQIRPLSLFSESGDELHAWPEYWDDNLGWVQVDPTWGKTSGGLDYFNQLDFNHITLVQRGVSSIEPYPAGSYKKEGQQLTKDVLISFAEELSNGTITPQLKLKTPKNLIAGIPTKVVAELQNVGTNSIINGDISLSTSQLKFSSPNTIHVPILPPLAKQEFKFSLQGKSLFDEQNDVLTVSFADAQVAIPILIVPIYHLLLSKGFVISLTISLAILGIGVYLHSRIEKRKVKIPT